MDDNTHLFEVYLKHPDSAESGWEIAWLYGTYEDVHDYPRFDMIITIDDPTYHGDPVKV